MCFLYGTVELYQEEVRNVSANILSKSDSSKMLRTVLRFVRKSRAFVGVLRLRPRECPKAMKLFSLNSVSKQVYRRYRRVSQTVRSERPGRGFERAVGLESCIASGRDVPKIREKVFGTQ